MPKTRTLCRGYIHRASAAGLAILVRLDQALGLHCNLYKTAFQELGDSALQTTRLSLCLLARYWLAPKDTNVVQNATRQGSMALM